MSQRSRIAWIAFLLIVGLTIPASAGVVVYDQDGRKIEAGARIQLQYVRTDPEEGDSEDDVLFRRLRPYVAGTVTENWWGKIELELGKAVDGDEVAIKDAYVQYKGWQNKTFTLGNSKTPFSREFLASSLRQQTVERGFVGDHNFGAPDRLLGLRLEGQNDGRKVTYMLAAGAESHDPDARKLDFDSPVNDQSDWNEGLVLAGRLDFHPRGYTAFDQGAFRDDGEDGEVRYNFSLAFFNWSNDDDNNTYTDPLTGRATDPGKVDLDRSQGYEVSAGLRGRGVSIDAEYQRISADTVDGSFTGGIYRDGTTDLDKFHLEGGYMLPGNRFEIVGAWEMLDADNYQDAWEGYELGVNYFWNQHDTKVQLTLRRDDDEDGARGVRSDTAFVQFQFAF